MPIMRRALTYGAWVLDTSAAQTQASLFNSTTCNVCRAYRLRSQSLLRDSHKSQRWHSTSNQVPSSQNSRKESFKPQTHYDLFPQSISQGPPPTGAFQIDIRALRKEFLQLQAQAHPDRHPQGFKLQAEAASARIN